MGLEQVTNITQVTEVFIAADGFGGGLLGIAILLIAGLGSLFLMSNFNTKDALISSSFVTLTVALFLKYLNLLGDGPLLFSIAIFFIALALSRIKTSNPV